MTLRKLLTKTSYKDTFNAIYKENLKKCSKSKVESFSVNLQKLHDSLKNLPKQQYKNTIKIEHTANSISIITYNKDDCLALDFVDWEDLIDREIVAPKNISDSRLAGFILWHITINSQNKDIVIN